MRSHSTLIAKASNPMKGSRSHLALVLIFLLLSAPVWALPTVVIDAGHGGIDRGGGPGQRIPEKPYALDTARRLQSALRSAGFRTIMTRDSDDFVSLGNRCRIANAQRNAIFISVHFNSAAREGANGIETYYYTRQSARLAAAVHAQVVRAAGTEDRHVRTRGFYVIRNTRIPSIIAECGFLTNGAEARRILTASHRQRLAEAIARGVIRVYK